MNQTRQRRKQGLKFALFGLAVGIILGLAVLTLKSFLVAQIEDLLNDEAQKACDCQFSADSISISFLTLRGTVENARIISGNEPKLIFEKVLAKFSLSRIGEKKIILSNLHLRDGIAYGVDEDSATFKFIDSLTTTPVKKPDGNDNGFKLRLEKLKISNSRFVQNYPDSLVRANYISMIMDRNQEDDFVLKPTIGELLLTLKPNKFRSYEKNIFLGKVSSAVTLTDKLAVFEKLKLLNRNTLVSLLAESKTDQDNALSGGGELKIDSSLLQISAFLDTILVGNTELSGSLGNPSAKGSLRLIDNSEVPFTISGVPLFYLNSLAANFDYDLNHGKHLLNVSNIAASGIDTSVVSNEPLVINDDKISADFNIKVDEVVFDSVKLLGVSARAQLKNTLSDLKFYVTGNANSVSTLGYITPNAGFSINNESELEFRISHESQEAGRFIANGKFVESDSGFEELDVDIEMSDFLMLPTVESSSTVALQKQQKKAIRLSGNTKLDGEFTLSKLNGNSKLLIESRHFAGESALQGTFKLDSGRLSARVFNASESISSDLLIDLKKQNGRFDLELNKFSLAEYEPRAKCMSISGTAEYNFSLATPSAGNGNIALESASLGCKPYAIKLLQKEIIPIKEGTAQIKSIVLKGQATSLSITGESAFDDLNVNIEGSSYLNAILGFLPALDDLYGQIDCQVALKGSFESPTINGTATISDAGFASEAADISAERLNGNLILEGDQVSLNYINGVINGGALSVQGKLNVFDLASSQLLIDIMGMTVDSIPDVLLVSSANLSLGLKEDRPLIEGTVTIDVLEAKKSINVATLVTSLILPTRQAKPESRPTVYPAVDLDIAFEANRNVFLYSSFLTAEFASDIHVGGTLNSPFVTGQLKTLSGWLGFKNGRFDITSGEINFDQNLLNPTLDIIGETSVFTRSGSFVTLIMEATGPLSNPEIVLSSDTGLTQNEILNLLATDIRNFEQSNATGFSSRSADGRFSLIDEKPGSAIRQVLHSFTTIDDISVQPSLNNRSGAIEPSLTATKLLTDNVALIGEYFLGPDSLSRIKLSYDFTPYLKIAGIFDTLSTEENSNLGIDLTITILSKKVPFIKYEIEGNTTLADKEVLDSVRLNENSRVLISELDRLTTQFQKFFFRAGYRHSLVVLNCQEGDIYCKKLQIKLFEGPSVMIAKRIVRGDALPKEISEDQLPEIAEDQLATYEYLQYQAASLTRLLRSEGYISAQVIPVYEETETHKADLVLELKIGSQESFVFTGNEAFGPAEFLETINLFDRKQPFGRNTIKILVENMERMYREAGYLFASINYETEILPKEKRTIYHVSITEESKVSVEAVRFSGNDNLTTSAIETKLFDRFQESYDSIINPKIVIAEELETATAIISATYALNGYPNASVSYRILKGSSDSEVAIEYIINEGNPSVFDKIEVVGAPTDYTVVEISENEVLSVPIINQYINGLSRSLQNSGYFATSLSTELEGKVARITISADERTKIGEISVEGAHSLGSDELQKFLTIKTGDPWNTEQLSQQRKDLLKRGLFSRVEMVAADGSLDSSNEPLLIRVVEKPLTTLEVGGGLNTELGVHAFGQAIDKSIFMDGSSIGLRTDLYIDEQNGQVNQGIAGLRYNQPTFLGTNYQFTQDARYQKLDIDTLEYDLERYILDNSFYRSFTDKLSLNFSYALLQDDITSVPLDAQLSSLDSGIVNLSLLSASLRWDGRDSPVLPSKGLLFALDLDGSARGIGSDANYYSIGSRLGYILPIGQSRFSIANHVKVGSSWAYGQTEAVPITQRYYLGGRQSIRGFRENSLGPRGENGSIIGGDILLQNNFDLRYRFAESFMTHVFLDAGNVFLRDQNPEYDHLRSSTGIGFRYLSPIGPIGFDIGHPLDEREGEPSIRVHFSVGSVF